MMMHKTSRTEAEEESMMHLIHRRCVCVWSHRPLPCQARLSFRSVLHREEGKKIFLESGKTDNNSCVLINVGNHQKWTCWRVAWFLCVFFNFGI